MADRTPPMSPSREASSLPVRASQSRAVLSSLAVTIHWPSALNRACRMTSVWPRRTFRTKLGRAVGKLRQEVRGVALLEGNGESEALRRHQKRKRKTG